MPHPKRRKINLPLLEIIVASLILHIVGLLILGGITIFNNIRPEDPDIQAPPLSEAPPPPVVKLPPAVQKTQSSPPKLIVAERPMEIKDLDFDMPMVERRVGVAGGIGSSLGGTGSLANINLSQIDFFSTRDKAESVCFIVDYSKSMKDKIKDSKVTREQLMRENLSASLQKINDQVMVSIIFFSGPAWLAGSSESQARKQYTDNGDDWHGWRAKENATLEQPKWHRFSDAYRREIIKTVQSEKLTGGTVWQNPLRLAMQLEPAPDVIFFLTDGATSEVDVEETLELVGEWKKKNPDLRIHTIALGEPKAASGMRRIAGRTGGQFKLIETLEDAQGGAGRGDG